ncbi:MAG TPA: M15 family metallopeptidase [Clostridia bacterium]|nr:M15 family metallopeptidase [Clostridia bacterium]
MERAMKQREKQRATVFLRWLGLAVLALAVTVIALTNARGETADALQEGYLVLVNWSNPVPYDRPDGLVDLDDAFGDAVYLLNPEGSINAEAGKAALAMFEAAKEDGVSGYMVTTAYRSVAYQQELFEARRQKEPGYGSDPFNEPVKVLPGECSEHTTGLALDILAEDYRRADDGYADTVQGKWLFENAYRFGFILRYPKGKENITGVIYEPWHYRYVGIDAAKEIYDSGQCLEEYLGQA